MSATIQPSAVTTSGVGMEPRAAGAASTVAAFAGNIGLACAKMVAWVLTGSASMFAEAVHSLADSANQGLLLLARRRSPRSPDEVDSPFGRERCHRMFLASIVLFGAGGLVAALLGVQRLRVSSELRSYPWTFGVLAVALCLEAVSLRTAVSESRERRRTDESRVQFVRRRTVPELAVVILQDSGALAGLVLALLATTVAQMTGNSRYDAIGGVGVGLLLVVIAITLATEMRRVLRSTGRAPVPVAIAVPDAPR